MHNNHKAFTLAEILVALSILGVVAAIIIPTAINNYKKRQTVTRLKIAYKILTEITEQSRIINGNIPPRNANSNAFITFVEPFVKIDKRCGIGIRAGGERCYASPKGWWYNMNGQEEENPAHSHSMQWWVYHVTLRNGMSLSYDNCESCMLWHRIFIVDIDGPRKGYSRLGQDVFIFEWAEATSGEVGYNRSSNRYYNDGLSHELVPYVGGGVTNYDYTGGWRRKDLSYQQKMESYRQNCIESGKACAAWIILNGWEIPRDYPWARVNQKPQGFIPVR